MSELTDDMRQWLTDNRDDYEFYLLHAMLHDKLRRISMLGVPVTPDDFSREEYALVVRALSVSSRIMGMIGKDLPEPPTVEFLRTYIESAARAEGLDDDAVAGALQLVGSLQDPSYSEQHYCVGPYFQAWYGSVRAKKAAMEIRRVDVPDVVGQIGKMQDALMRASQAVTDAEVDEMDEFFESEDVDRIPRRPTGIAGLDIGFNGGWGSHECYLLFGGTGGGKSVAAGQCAWNEASANKGWPLIVSTELFAREYTSRTVSNAAGIPINVVQDCANAAQIRQAVAADPGSMYRLGKVDEVLELFRSRIRIHKVSSDAGMEARMLLEREALKYESKMGRLPTWMCLDWLGSVADVSGGSGKGTSERAMIWEMAAFGCVKFAEESGIPLLVLAQAVNDSQLKPVLTLNDIGISKGIGKNMTVVIGITNTMDKAGVADAMRGKADMPKAMILEHQFFCLAKARKGEGDNIPVCRDFRFQRFKARDKP